MAKQGLENLQKKQNITKTTTVSNEPKTSNATNSWGEVRKQTTGVQSTFDPTRITPVSSTRTSTKTIKPQEAVTPKTPTVPGMANSAVSSLVGSNASPEVRAEAYRDTNKHAGNILGNVRASSNKESADTAYMLANLLEGGKAVREQQNEQRLNYYNSRGLEVEQVTPWETGDEITNSLINSLYDRSNRKRDRADELAEDAYTNWGQYETDAGRTIDEVFSNAGSNALRWGKRAALSVLGVPGLDMLSDASMFLSSAGDVLRDARANGADDGNAMAYALATGLANAGFEHLSEASNPFRQNATDLDTFIGNQIKSSNLKPAVQYVANLIAGAGEEGLEEYFTELATQVARRATIGDDQTYAEGAADRAKAFLMGGASALLLGGFVPDNSYSKYKEDLAMYYWQMSDAEKGEVVDALARVFDKDPALLARSIEDHALDAVKDMDGETLMRAIDESPVYIDPKTGSSIYEITQYSDDQKVAQDYAKRAGVDQRTVEELDPVTGKNGKRYIKNGFVTDDGQIIISSESKTPIMDTVGHEIVHVGSDTEEGKAFLQFAVDMEKDARGEEGFNEYLKDLSEEYSSVYDPSSPKFNGKVLEEVGADFSKKLWGDPEIAQRLLRRNGNVFNRVYQSLQDAVSSFKGTDNLTAEQKQLIKAEKLYSDMVDRIRRDAIMDGMGLADGESVTKQMLDKLKGAIVQRGKRGEPMTTTAQVAFSMSEDTPMMDSAKKVNEESKKKNNGVPFVSDEVMERAEQQRLAVKALMSRPKVLAVLPADDTTTNGKANTKLKNGSYGISEENTTVCVRMMSNEYVLDRVAESIGRPLNVSESLKISQMFMQWAAKAQCLYCYEGMDRWAKREFHNRWFDARDYVVGRLTNGDSFNDVYADYLEKFLGRKPDQKNGATDKRMQMWQKIANGEMESMPRSALASVDARDKAWSEHPEWREQLKNADGYAQSASYAKKKIAYTAYDGHILSWSDKFVNQLNSDFGMRMYSFSDFSKAFILENMQMVTDASVKGLKGLAYTKEEDFVKIFAPTGMLINCSTFGMNTKNGVERDEMQGMKWEDAQALRAKYPNVGVIFVATNNEQVEWGLDQDWIDVVIPFHTVKTGDQIAATLNYTNYRGMQEDRKLPGWDKNKHVKSISPAMHNNDLETYLHLCEENYLEPRFKEWLDNPNYMKLVNETRLPYNEAQPMQPNFDISEVESMLDDFVRRGGFENEGYGSVKIPLTQVADRIANAFIRDGGAKYSAAERFSLSDEGAESFEDFIDDAQTNKYNNVPISVLNESLIPMGLRIEEVPKGYAMIWTTPSGGEVSLQEDVSIPQLFRRKLNILSAVEGREQNWKPIDYTAPEEIRETYPTDDESYMAALENGDTELAKNIVEQRAREKGYTDKGYHGTLQFGFTVPDTQYSDDKLSFFATNDIDTAKTYSGIDGVNQISDRNPTASELEAAMESLEDESHDASLDFAEALNRTAGFYNYIDGSYVQSEIESHADDDEYLGDLFYDWIANANSDYEDYEEWMDSEEADALFSKAWDAVDAYKTYEDFIDKNTFLLENLNTYDTVPGNYELAINPEGLLNIEGYGHNWDGIRADLDDKITNDDTQEEWIGRKFWNTRDLAQFANEQGYSGFKVSNLYDNGGRTGETLANPADVYALFNPQSQVKSLDAVTYDDERNIIPLSERFNPNKNDIRYSLDDDYMTAVADGNVEEQDRIIEQAARNAGYNSPKLYHGTSNGNFTVFDKNRVGSNYGDWGRVGKGFYFTAKESDAKSWGEKGRGNHSTRVIPAYLKMDNALNLYEAAPDPVREYIHNQFAVPENWEGSFTEDFLTKSLYRTIDFLQDERHMDASAVLQSLGYDGVYSPDGAEYVVYEPSQIKSAEPITYDKDGNVIPPSQRFDPNEDDIRYSLSEDYNEKFTDRDGIVYINDVNALTNSDWKTIQKAVDKLGYGIGSAEAAKEVFSRYVPEYGFNAEQSDAIRKAFGVAEQKVKNTNPERATLAKKEFGTTGNFNEAGYLLQDGKMLDFSGKREGGSPNTRAMDHREINRVFDETGDGSASWFMNHFIDEGNIRLMPERGVTIGEIEPTAAQYSVLKRYIEHVLDTNGDFGLDISNEQGYTIASREYSSGDKASRIINDIKAYFKDGELPYRSQFADFRYSLSEDIPEQANAFPDRVNQNRSENRFLGAWDRESESEDPYTYEEVSPEKMTEPDSYKVLMEDVDEDYEAPDPEMEEVDFYQSLVPNGKAKGGNRVGASLGFNTIEQAFDTIAGRDTEARKILDDTFIKPLYEAKREYVSGKDTNLRGLYDMAKKLDIWAGTKESAAAQWLGEGYKTEDGKQIPYTLEDLKKDFPNKWQNIQAMTEYIRKGAEDYVSRWNAMLEQVYPDPDRKHQEDIATWTKQVENLKLGLESAYAIKNPGVAESIEMDIANLQRKIDETQRKIDNGDYRVGKRLTPRKNYFHHFNEIETKGIKGLKNLVAAAQNASGKGNIDPELVGKSEWTQPRSRWMPMLQRRGKGEYTADAVKGFAKYIENSEYAIAFNPVIAHYRDEINKIRKATKQTKNANTMIDYLSDYTNHLAGKTSYLDRAARKILGGDGSRQNITNFFIRLNNRAKSNAVMGNIQSILKQASNLPNGLANVKSRKAWAKGIADWGKNLPNRLAGKETTGAPMDQSVFLNERYFDLNTRDFEARDSVWKKLKGKVSDFSSMSMEILDKMVAEQIWSAAYYEGIEKGVDDPIYYADDLTKRSVAGRGVGEVPYAMDSAVTKFFMPFQVEVNNQWQGLKGMIRNKDAMGLVTLSLAAYAMNGIYSALGLGDVVPSILGAIIDGLKDLFDKDREETAGEVALNTGRRIAGEAVSYMPGTSLWIPAIMSDESSKALFGEADPTRYGTGTVGLSNVAKVAADIFDGDDKVDLMTPLFQLALPSGGRQASRIYNTMQDFNILPSNGWANTPFGGEKTVANGDYSKSGALKYRLPDGVESFDDAMEIAKAFMLGSNATNAAQEYFDNGNKPLLTKERVEKLKENPEVDVDHYIEYLHEANTDGKGGISQREAYKWLSGNEDLTDEERSALWSMTNSQWENTYDTYKPQNETLVENADEDGNGRVTQEEAYKWLSQQYGMTQDEKQAMWEENGWSKSYKKYTDDYVESLKEYNGYTRKDLTKEVDTDESGSMSQEELYQWLKNQTMSEADKREMWKLGGWKSSYDDYKNKESTRASNAAKKELTEKADSDKSGTVTQAEMYAYLMRQNMTEFQREREWEKMGWKTSYSDYKKKHS